MIKYLEIGGRHSAILRDCEAVEQYWCCKEQFFKRRKIVKRLILICAAAVLFVVGSATAGTWTTIDKSGGHIWHINHRYS